MMFPSGICVWHTGGVTSGEGPIILYNEGSHLFLCACVCVCVCVFVCERERERTVIISLLILTYFMIQFYLMLIGDYHV